MSDSLLLTELRIRGFKCFREEVTLPFARLNLLTGVNGKGKSTALQALLLLHQAVDKTQRVRGRLDVIRSFDLNGRYMRLGTYREILHRDLPLSEGIDIAFEVTDRATIGQVKLTLAAEDEASRFVSPQKPRQVERFVNNEPVDLNEPSEFEKWTGSPEPEWQWDNDSKESVFAPEQAFLRAHYISADRLGPQEFFRWADEGLGQDPFVGIRGENTAEVLREARFHTVHPSVARAEADATVVPDQASAWLGYVFDGGKLKEGPASEAVLTLLMNSDNSVHYVRPVHMGFGYSYLLPILVSGLVAQPGSMLLVENPEAHLHPLAQSRVGEFLAKVAAAGVQVYVESHSEHILNAFRLAVRDTVLAADDLSVLYFRRDEVEPVLRIPVDAKGGIRSWPDGFFDQRLHDFQRLFGV